MYRNRRVCPARKCTAHLDYREIKTISPRKRREKKKIERKKAKKNYYNFVSRNKPVVQISNNKIEKVKCIISHCDACVFGRIPNTARLHYENTTINLTDNSSLSSTPILIYYIYTDFSEILKSIAKSGLYVQLIRTGGGRGGVRFGKCLIETSQLVHTPYVYILI